ncbi:MAG: methyltransferase domain-containing protein [Candidatus Saccharibacteria bacterium]|nr:methyltransferase domain-containing protein [Candidatus Saccharibacteria bacterium]
MRYLAVLGRQPEISLAELSALFSRVSQVSNDLATFSANKEPSINRLGGCLKLAAELNDSPLEYLKNLPEGKITIGVSDYSARSSARKAQGEALKLKKILSRHGRSVRVVENKSAVLSTATSLHNGLGGSKTNKVELILINEKWWRVIGVQDIDAYARRDQARPARDAKVGMLPPKLAQILINLCGPLPAGARVLDPFCGTGVVLQEALLMGYQAYGTDLSERMIEYSKKNLEWLSAEGQFQVSQGDATSFTWEQPINAVACEGYLGQPMSLPPADIKLKTEKQECSSIILGFLKNLAPQIKSNTPVVVAMPAWLRPDGSYHRMNLVDEIANLGYNVMNKTREGLLYHRDNQVVARDIIILRKK